MADEPQGRVRPTSWRVLVGVLVLGLVAGWFGGAILEGMDGVAPSVPWVAVFLLLFAAAVLAATGWTTWRTIHRQRRWMEAQRAVNYLVLAKASALVGALVAGAYAGFGARFLNDLVAPLPQERVLRSTLAVGAAVLVVVFALLLERACRVPKTSDDEEDHPNDEGRELPQ